MASVVSHPLGMLLFSNPNSSRQRVALTVRRSTDGGKTWSGGNVLDPRPSAYSSMAVLSDGTVGVLYETGDRGGYETLTFARFSVGWLRDEAAGTE
jgi:sialidase-1